MDFRSLLFTLAALGMSETVYLIKKRLLLQKPICPFGEDCHTVLTSKYKKLFIIHNDVAGFLFYIVLAVIIAFLVIGIGPAQLLNKAMALLIAAGSLLSVFFTYLQWRVIKAWCFWCLMSAFTIWSMSIILLLDK